jgi:hypothetical protein
LAVAVVEAGMFLSTVPLAVLVVEVLEAQELQVAEVLALRCKVETELQGLGQFPAI